MGDSLAMLQQLHQIAAAVFLSRGCYGLNHSSKHSKQTTEGLNMSTSTPITEFYSDDFDKVAHLLTYAKTKLLAEIPRQLRMISYLALLQPFKLYQKQGLSGKNSVKRLLTVPIHICKRSVITILNGGSIAGAAIAAFLSLTIQSSTSFYNRWNISSRIYACKYSSY